MGRSTIVKAVVLLLFFLSTLWLSVGVPEGVFVSPDENANGVFATLFATTQELRLHEPLNDSLDDLIFSRSTIALGSWIMPVSFLGLPVLYGTVGSMLGTWSLAFLTPLLATLAVMAWYGLVTSIWNDKRLAEMSALALMIHPAFWYYTSRGLMHNVLFVSLLIFSGWFWVREPFRQCDRHELLDKFAAGICLGLALATRGGELVWVVALMLGLLLWVRKALTWRRVMAFLVGIGIALLPFASLQTSLFGAPWRVGYNVQIDDAHQAQTLEIVETSDSAFGLWLASSSLGPMLFPFGIHERNILDNGLRYGLQLYPWMTLLALAGMVVLARDRRWRPWLIVTLLLGLWLLVVYGSWSFADNPDPSAVTIGDSHVRYWLPVFILMTPFVGYLFRFAQKKRSTFRFPALAAIILCTALSAQLVFLSPDGVIAARAQLFVDAQKREIILTETTSDSIIIVDYADKYLFPDRSVVVPLRDERTYTALPAMVDLTEVYYFGITLPQEDLDYLNDEKFTAMNVRIDSVVTIDQETLYRIEGRGGVTPPVRP